MLAKLAVLLSKVPHTVIALATLAAVYLPKLVLTGTPLEPYAPYVAGALALANTILALAKQFNPGTVAATKSDAAIIAKQGVAGETAKVAP